MSAIHRCEVRHLNLTPFETYIRDKVQGKSHPEALVVCEQILVSLEHSTEHPLDLRVRLATLVKGEIRRLSF